MIKIPITMIITEVNPTITISCCGKRLVFSRGLISEWEERPPPPELLHASSSADSPFLVRSEVNLWRWFQLVPGIKIRWMFELSSFCLTSILFIFMIMIINIIIIIIIITSSNRRQFHRDFPGDRSSRLHPIQCSQPWNWTLRSCQQGPSQKEEVPKSYKEGDHKR